MSTPPNSLPPAFTSVTIRAISPEGWPVEFGVNPAPGSTAQAIAFLEKHGYQPAETQPVMAVEPTPVGSPGQTASFIGGTLTATVDDGKAFWKVKGGAFSKFGIMVWPETLAAAGFDPDKMNPLKPVDLSGWSIYYTVKDNGQPKKVVRLERS